ncbi:Mss4p nuclear export [Tulasnella sp. 330]|nr:Mss4p nuclear export [Tulasnella sp. 330]KAG8879802.1 Mss4p nuclear export [Tulasnella sp. 331]
MPKRKGKTASSDEDDSGSEVDLVNVDFEFFDPRETDYLAIKRLLRQLLQLDAEDLHLNDLTDLILSQPLVGTTVKTDGIESDPYAFLTVLNMNVHKDHPSIKALVSYLLAKATGNPAAQAALRSIIGPEALASSSSRHVGLLLGERMINMPVQIIPPMYRMLGDEIRMANDDKEPYNFDHYIVLSRLYKITEADVSSMTDDIDEPAPPTKKQKKKGKGAKQQQQGLPQVGTFSFHHEDEEIQNVASFTVDYDFSNRQPREGSESLGLDVAGRFMIVPSARFAEMVTDMTKSHPLPST